MSGIYTAFRSFVFVVITLLCSSAPLWAASSVPQVFLVQNSGWMLPFYDDPGSRLKDIVAELSDRVRKYGGEQQVVASFNQTWGKTSPPVCTIRETTRTRSTRQYGPLSRRTSRAGQPMRILILRRRLSEQLAISLPGSLACYGL